ncbi:fibrinogen-like protein A [Saccostrea echinata]|uniref:fibrinogen-like protein A n=1 Tax=Saccostrea echinata TaxID=191078 RepID=UPI002A81657E|nr:fibrinogen-like protein A [Saccostrea echinata]
MKPPIQNRLIPCILVFFQLALCSGYESIEIYNFSNLYECDWNIYNNTEILKELRVKSKVSCAILCLQYEMSCRGFELYRMSSVTSCRLFYTASRQNCAPSSSSTSSFYRRKITYEMTTSIILTTTITEELTTSDILCQNGGTLTGSTCSCVFGCSGQYCQTCINECKDATGVSGTGIAWIKPSGFDVAKQVWCNFDHGVTYFQVRKFGNVNFNRSFAEYENGFGDANGDYWLGNRYVYILTNLRGFNAGFTLMKSGNSVKIYYYDFVVLDSTASYAVQYSSTSSASYPAFNGKAFQAYDTVSACALSIGCGWWFGSTCSSGSLNGPYPVAYGVYSGATTTWIGIY